MTALLVALGAAIGAPLRYLTDRAVQSRNTSAFPWGTLVVNLAGSLVLGFVLARPTDPAVSALLGTGFCGALTTYSTFSYETLRLLERGAGRVALLNITTSVVAGLAAACCGVAAANLLP